MRPGSPFKYRGSSTPYVGVLSTPDIIKYKVPVPYAFVPSNPKYDPKQINSIGYIASKPIYHVDEKNFNNNAECKTQINNFNKCVRNNNYEACAYYLNYLNFNCK